MLKNRDDAYAEASKFNNMLNNLLQESPITKENLTAWTLFLRTVKSYILTIEEDIETRYKQGEFLSKK